jgi:4,5-dihydroxyphthalate decarboxylase
MARLELSAGLTVSELTAPLLDGTVVPDGISWQTTGVHASELFWRQLKFSEFDVSEMSMSSLMIEQARTGTTEWVALPIFTTRMFSHLMIKVRNGAGIEKPSDLNGKRVGVPEYQQTSAVWSRGILQHEFGVDLTSIEWFMERPPEKSHGGATGFTPPPGIRLQYIPPTSDIGQMLLDGTLDATLLYLTDRNLVDRSRTELGGNPDVRPLFPTSEGPRFFKKTGVIPINHGLVVRRRIYEEHPWVVLNIYNAFMRAKEIAWAPLRSGLIEPFSTVGLIDESARAGLRGDPFPYGIKASLPTLDMLARILHEQGLTNRVVGLDEIFAKQTLDL